MSPAVIPRKWLHPIVTLFAALSAATVFTFALRVAYLHNTAEIVRLRNIGFLRLAYTYLDHPTFNLDPMLPALVSRHFGLSNPDRLLPLLAWAPLSNLPVAWTLALVLSPLVWMLARRFPPSPPAPRRELFWWRTFPLASFLAIPSLFIVSWFKYGAVFARLSRGTAPSVGEIFGLAVLPAVWAIVFFLFRKPDVVLRFLKISTVLGAAILAVGLAGDLVQHPPFGLQSSRPLLDGGKPAPNILLVSIDTLRRDHLGGYGYERATSPSIDSLAREGALFKTVVAPSSWTLPVHATLLTSLPPTQHGLINVRTRLTSDALTISTTLREQNYATAAFVSAPVLDAGYGLWRGFDYYDDHTYKHVGFTGDCRVSSPALVDATKNWLKRWDRFGRGKPFFLFLHLYDIHPKLASQRRPGAPPYCSPPPYRDLYDPAYRGENKGQFLIENKSTTERMSERDLIHNIALYDEGIRYVDDQLGVLFAFLEDLDVKDRTIISLISDHGEEFY